MTLPDAPLAVGRTAEIYAWGEGRILKLVRPGFPPYLADQEWHYAAVAFACGAPAPQPIDLLEVDGRRGVVFERIEGPTMGELIKKAPWRTAYYARQLAGLHARLHQLTAPSLPSLKGRRKRNLMESALLPDTLKPPLLALLEGLPDSSAICHADFHPENILYTARGPLIIDWEGSMHGPCAADVANTLLLLRSVRHHAQGSATWMLRLLVPPFERAYLAEYRRLSPGNLEHLDEWLAIQAAHRLSDENRREIPDLLRIIKQVVTETP